MKEDQSVEYKESWRAGNPDIANTFFPVGLNESWGRGTLKIIQDCKDGGLPAPEFRYDLSGFLIEFKTVEKTVEKSSRVLLIQILKENPTITIKDLQTKLALSRRGVEWNLNKLKTDNKIERIGPAKGGYWKVIDSNENKQL